MLLLELELRRKQNKLLTARRRRRRRRRRSVHVESGCVCLTTLIRMGESEDMVVSEDDA